MATRKSDSQSAPIEVPEGQIRVRASLGATAISHCGREYEVEADGFVAIHPDDYEPLRAVGAIVIG